MFINNSSTHVICTQSMKRFFLYLILFNIEIFFLFIISDRIINTVRMYEGFVYISKP